MEWGRGYHKTRSEYVESILRVGLELGGTRPGQMRTSIGMQPWPNRAYGCHPVYVFLDPVSPEIIEWTPIPGRDEATWEWLTVDLAGLRLYVDLWLLRDLTGAGASDVGFWWGSSGPQPGAEPPPLSPFLDPAGVVSNDALTDTAGRAAIELTRSAAILAPVPASRVARYEAVAG